MRGVVEGHFAEGNKGLFDTYYQILNPQPTAQTVGVTYRHENGVVYSGSLTVGARSRATVLLPGWLPDGSLGVTLSAAQGFVAERAVYGGTGWTLGPFDSAESGVAQDRACPEHREASALVEGRFAEG